MPDDVLMVNEVLIPAETVVTTKGDSPAVDISSAAHRVFLLTLRLNEVAEQEYLEVSLFGSTDGTTWGSAPLATLPQRFYSGEYPTLLDLSADQDTKFLRLHWEVARWGRGELTPRFVCAATLREVPRETLAEAQSFAR